MRCGTTHVAVALAVCALSALSAAAQALPAAGKAAPASRAEVLVLGVYHMANPGHDIFNMQADDVLAPKRQAEIAQVIAALRNFHPTKIAVEGDVYGDRIARTYAEYLAGKHELTRNEIEQLGFRLARELGHKTVYAVDVDGEFPYLRVVNYAKASGRTKELDAIMAEFEDMVKVQDAYLASHTILETLLFMNSDDKAAQNTRLYYRLAQIGEPGDWAGADLVSDWFRRNVRIYSNVARIAETRSERVLVIYGAGHLAWLQNSLVSNANYRLRKFAEFVPPN